MTKTLLLASFVNQNKLQSLKNYLKNNFNINNENIFIYEVEENNKLIVTFKIEVESGERLDVKKHFKNTLLVHKKGSTFYTINALNKLIELENNITDKHNIDYKAYKVNWENYSNKLIIINNNELQIINLKRILS